MNAKTVAGGGRCRPTIAQLEREIRAADKLSAKLLADSERMRLEAIEDVAAARAEARKWRERAELQTQQIQFWIDRLTVALTDWQKKGPKEP